MIHWGIEEFFMKDNSSFPIKHSPLIIDIGNHSTLPIRHSTLK